MRAGVEAHGEYHPFACGWPAGGLTVEAMHLQGEPVREVCTDQRCSKSSPGVSDMLGMQLLLLERGWMWCAAVRTVPGCPVGMYEGKMCCISSKSHDARLAGAVRRGRSAGDEM